MYKSKVTELKKMYKDDQSGNDAVQNVFTENYFIPDTEQSVMYRSRFSTYTRGMIAKLFKDNKVIKLQQQEMRTLNVVAEAEAVAAAEAKAKAAAAEAKAAEAAAAAGGKPRKTKNT
jgi:hypothetical protein